MVRKPVLRHLFRGEEITAIEDDRGAHQCPHPVEIGAAELAPFGDDDQGVSTFQRIVIRGGVRNPVAKDPFGDGDRFRIVGLNLRARGKAPRFVDGLRVTDDDTLETVVAVLAGRINTAFVAALVAAGVKAVGSAVLDSFWSVIATGLSAP